MSIHPLQSSDQILLNDVDLELRKGKNTEISLQKAQVGTYGALKM